MIDSFREIVKKIAGTGRENIPLSKVNVCGQFNPGQKDNVSIAGSLNAAFLISLSGPAHPLYNDAANYLKQFEDNPQWAPIIQFYTNGLRLIEAEISER